MIKKFDNFINEEVSKNDPIPELSRDKSKLGIILLGTPGSGKSTFAKKFIHNTSKTFSTDDISLLFTKDPNKYYKNSSDLNINKLLHFLQSGQNFIYDTTGTQNKNILKIFSEAKKVNYKIIFIHILVSLDKSKLQNKNRERNVPDDYIELSYNSQYPNMIEYDKLNPDNYYIVQHHSQSYKFFKYKNGILYKRKVDHYVPVNKNSKNESINLPVEIGDTIFMGRFKNKKTIIRKIDVGDDGMPTINGKKVVNFRIKPPTRKKSKL